MECGLVGDRELVACIVAAGAPLSWSVPPVADDRRPTPGSTVQAGDRPSGLARADAALAMLPEVRQVSVVRNLAREVSLVERPD